MMQSNNNTDKVIVENKSKVLTNKEFYFVYEALGGYTGNPNDILLVQKLINILINSRFAIRKWNVDINALIEKIDKLPREQIIILLQEIAACRVDNHKKLSYIEYLDIRDAC